MYMAVVIASPLWDPFSLKNNPVNSREQPALFVEALCMVGITPNSLLGREVLADSLSSLTESRLEIRVTKHGSAMSNEVLVDRNESV